ncbi:hypothetical protein L3X38_030135 [Prunus dulcis]|uniref:Splicing factor RBM39 linker domain-containing protein n=1 Tax=Prunus dulcis TaxID=3755 RepID=A0AAD4V9P7_PRUDU|nr:hypothetical protein L3X38_030135 [Prunus dulcis]
MKSKQREEGEGGAGKKMISVSAVTDQAGMQDLGANAGDFDDDEGGGLSLNARSRSILMQKLDRSGSGSGLYCWSPSLGTPAVNSTGRVSLPTAPFLGAAPVVSPLVPPITAVSGIAGLGVAIPTATLPSIDTIVFKGTLKDGQEIAVKRLSTHSRQGLNELKNEAWMLYTEGRSIEVLDTSVGDSSDLHEVVRSIHVGLSSVQRNPADRPSMPAAVVMLSGEGSSPQPQKPGFYSQRDLNELEVDPSSKAFSANVVTVLLH